MNETLAKAGMYGGSASAIFGWFSLNEWCALIGAIVGLFGGVLTFLSWLDRRAEHKLTMRIKRAQLKELGDAAQES